jgi:Uma2 family endonuclease
METAAKRRLTAREYLFIERKAETRSEFVDGEMFAMAGGTERHSLIAANLIRELGNALKDKSCQVFTSDMRLKVEATNSYTYPDVQVACGRLRFEDEMRDTLLNPKVVIEVLSVSTAAWDRGRKFWHYRHLNSLTDYVLVSQDGWLVEHYARQSGGAWRIETLDTAKATLALNSIKARVPLMEIYAKTGLKPGILPPDQNPEPRNKR